MRRLFWLALGLGAGAAGAIMSARFLRRQREKVAPARLAREAHGGMLDLAKLVSESIAEGKQAMREREEALHREGFAPSLEDSTSSTTGAAAGPKGASG